MGKYPRLALLRRIIEYYGNEETLFRYLRTQGRLDKKDLHFLQKINDLVTEEFVDSDPRYSGEPYVTHLHATTVIAAVYCGFNYDVEILAATLLHDIREEFPHKWTEERVREHSTARTASIVTACTIDRNLHYYDHEEERMEFYFREALGLFERVIVKGSDRLHNQLTLEFCTPKQQEKKNRETERFILPAAIAHSFLEEEFRESIRETDERLAHILTP